MHQEVTHPKTGPEVNKKEGRSTKQIARASMVATIWVFSKKYDGAYNPELISFQCTWKSMKFLQKI